MEIITITVSYNYFGDTVLSLFDKQYPMFQYGCRLAKDLLAKVKGLIAQGNTVLVVEDETDFNKVKIFSALKYIADIIKLDEEAYEATKYQPLNTCRGAEISGRYGY